MKSEKIEAHRPEENDGIFLRHVGMHQCNTHESVAPTFAGSAEGETLDVLAWLSERLRKASEWLLVISEESTDINAAFDNLENVTVAHLQAETGASARPVLSSRPRTPRFSRCPEIFDTSEQHKEYRDFAGVEVLGGGCR